MSLKKRIVTLIFFGFCLSSSADIYRAKYDKYITLVSPKIREVLIESGYCKDSNDCNRKNILFLESEKEELNIYLYEVNNLSVSMKVANEIHELYEESNSNFSVKFRCYKEKFNSRNFFVKSFYKIKPEFILFIKGDQ